MQNGISVKRKYLKTLNCFAILEKIQSTGVLIFLLYCKSFYKVQVNAASVSTANIIVVDSINIQNTRLVDLNDELLLYYTCSRTQALRRLLTASCFATFRTFVTSE